MTPAGTETPVRTLCLWCPDWPVVAARRRDPGLDGVPVAVLDGGFVLAASEEARSEGVQRGLRRRDAEARCPGLAVLSADPPSEARLFEMAARAVEALAPQLALDRPGMLFVPTRGPSRYFGGDDAFAAKVRTEVAAISTAIKIGMADGSFAARLAARRALPDQSFLVEAGESPAFLAPWPVRVLDDPDLAGLLARLGLSTLGDFAALPTGAVLGRFGLAGLVAQRKAQGLEEFPPEVRVPPPDVAEETHFDPPVSRIDMATFAGRALGERLANRLHQDGLTCTRVRVEAETEHAERLVRCWRLGAGAETSTVLAERVRGQLEAWVSARSEEGTVADSDEVTSGLTLLRLVPEEVVLAGRSQLGLWGGDRAAAERAARTLVRAQSLLGHDAVVSPVLQGGRSPDERVAWVPFGDTGTSPTENAPWPGAIPGPAPAVVFQPARTAELLDAAGRAVTISGRGEVSARPARLFCPVLPRGGGEVTAWAGPWLHNLRWWDADGRRRRAVWQVVAAGVACLVAVEGGEARVEALYD